MSQILRWGIMGTGNIARQFAQAVAQTARRSTLAAVGSRSADAAATFAQAHQIPNAHPTYDALLTDNTVDAVYISLPNSLHHEWTLKALRAGKHVLCEKPFALSAAQAQEMFDAARKAGRVLVEAFMYRSHPLTHAVIDSVRAGEIGDLRLVRTSFCYKTARIDGNVRFDRKLGGGALMDIGCYCINFSRLITGEEPASVSAAAHLHERGVDDCLVATMTFPSGVLASFTCGMTLHADNTAHICGSDGYIEIPIPWKPPTRQATFTLARSTPPRMDLAAGATVPPRETRTLDAPADLYALEADDFAAAVLDGKPPALPERDTLGNMTTLDELRRQTGVAF